MGTPRFHRKPNAYTANINSRRESNASLNSDNGSSHLEHESSVSSMTHGQGPGGGPGGGNGPIRQNSHDSNRSGNNHEMNHQNSGFQGTNDMSNQNNNQMPPYNQVFLDHFRFR